MKVMPSSCYRGVRSEASACLVAAVWPDRIWIRRVVADVCGFFLSSAVAAVRDRGVDLPMSCS